jgi:hypothetical protein
VGGDPHPSILDAVFESLRVQRRFFDEMAGSIFEMNLDDLGLIFSEAGSIGRTASIKFASGEGKGTRRPAFSPVS